MNGSIATVSDEERLVRFWRCLSEPEQHDMLVEIGRRALAHRPLGHTFGPLDEQEAQRHEELRLSLEERLAQFHPTDFWELAGAFDSDWWQEDEALDQVDEVVLGLSTDDSWHADSLAESFLNHCRHFSISTMDEFLDVDEEIDERSYYTYVFMRFLTAWRRIVIERTEQVAPVITEIGPG